MAAVVTRISQNALPYGHFLCSSMCSVVVCIDTTELKWSNIILNCVRQHIHFITQGNYKATCFDYSHPQAYFVNCVTRCYAQFGIPLCLYLWNTCKHEGIPKCA